VVNKSEAIQLLVRQVAMLQERGYTFEMIAQLLTQRGMPISAGSLKTYFSRARRAKRPRRKTSIKTVKDAEATRASDSSKSKNYPAASAGEKSGDTNGEMPKTSPGKPGGFIVRPDSPKL
jgi:hypothetical protein